MNKRRPSLSAEQLAFTFEPPSPARRAADLAGLDRVIASAVGQALKDDHRSREEIAGAMSALLAEDVSRFMLDAYASEARGEHNISAARLLALLSVTNRHDILDTLASRIGARVLVGEEFLHARAGHLRSTIEAAKAELRDVEKRAKPIKRLRP